MECTGTSYDIDYCRAEKMGCPGCNHNMEETTEYKLCYINGNKAWFTNDFENQWGDDWDDAPYEHNAGEPYSAWYENLENDKTIEHIIKHKVLYFETNDWSETRPCDNYLNSPYSVEDINKQAIAWLHTDKFNILAGTSYKDFIKIIENNNGKIYILKGE